jgi:hypothetical protein
MRGALTAAFGLTVLQVAVSSGAPKIAGGFDVLNSFVQRAFDPNVPAIPLSAERQASLQRARESSAALIDAQMTPFRPAPAGSTPTRTDWQANSPFPPGLFG